MRTSFELKILASTLIEAKLEADKHIAAFVGCDLEAVSDKVDVELKVKTIDLNSDPKSPRWSESTDLYEVTVFGTLKHNVLRPV